jgi:hypothetical protein
MKWLLLTFILINFQAKAQYKDLNPGEIYHDDIIRDDRMVRPDIVVPVPQPRPLPPPSNPSKEAVEEKKVHKPKRKPSSLFQEVKAGGKEGDFHAVP